MDSSIASKFPALALPESWHGSRVDSAVASQQEGLVATDVLLARIAQGDQQAFDCLFLRYERIVRSIALRILGDFAEAEDLAQDLFLFIQKKCFVFDTSKSSGGSWIVHMAYQRAIERRRRLMARHFYKREDLRSAASHLVAIPTTEDDYSPEAVFGRNGLENMLRTLSDDQRETLCLFFFEGYTLSEISVKLGQSLGNVRNHYYRALDKLRKQMFQRKVQKV